MMRPRPDYLVPRSKLGLPQKVFQDKSKSRRRRLVRALWTLHLVVATWLLAFAIDVASAERLSSGFPAAHHQALQASLDGADIPRLGAVSHDHQAQSFIARPDDNCSKIKASSSAVAREVFAFLPSALPWAPFSLEDSCGHVTTLLPEWHTLQHDGSDFTVETIGQDSQKPILRYAQKHGDVQIIPVVSVSGLALERLMAEDRSAPYSAAAVKALNAAIDEINGDGMCLDLSTVTNLDEPRIASLASSFASALKSSGSQSCLVVSARTNLAEAANISAAIDKVILKTAVEPWVGSPVGPLAHREEFEKRVEEASDTIGAEKLVIAIGTYSADWTTGRPKPEILPFAEAMTRLEQAQTPPEFDPASGTMFARYTDEKGRRHTMWMLDAVSAFEQLRVIESAGLTSVALSSLGQEDPGIWPVIAGAANSDMATLRQITFRNYVKHFGTGPFVEPIARPKTGIREISLNAETGQIEDQQYLQIPRASAVSHYGAGSPGQVVLTFDDGPRPEYTETILDILNATGTPGSFFVLGQNALQFPDLLNRILDDGHELGSHTFAHPNMGQISETRARIEVNSVQMLLNGATGRATHLYREPYMRSGGPISASEVETLIPLSSAGYVIAGMDVVPRDWEARTYRDLVDDTIRQVESGQGSVILLHDGGGDQRQTVEALPLIIFELRARGYEFVQLSDLLGVPKETLMPEVGMTAAFFRKLSFWALGGSWSILETSFWILLTVGIGRAVFMMIFALRRRKHVASDPGYRPSVSIVIPAFNEVRVIRKCLESALASDYEELNIVIVDDGSSDDTWKQVAPYLDFDRVRLIRQPNRGKAAALNAALDETDAEILVCIDADSEIHPFAVRRLVQHFADPKIGAVAGKVIVGNRGRLLTRLQTLEYITAQAVERRAKERFNAIPVVPGAIGAWRANAVFEAGIFSEETLTEDADLTMSVIRSGYRIVYEESAVATTEAPNSLGSLMAQRLRWSLGMMQACWKHRRAFREGRGLGLVTLPDVALFGYLLPLLAPMADLFLLLLLVDHFSGLMSGTPGSLSELPEPALLAYLILPLIETAVIILAFSFDSHEDRRLLWLIPIQRIVYRPLLYLSVLRAMWRAATGQLARWSGARRTGYSYDLSRIS